MLDQPRNGHDILREIVNTQDPLDRRHYGLSGKRALLSRVAIRLPASIRTFRMCWKKNTGWQEPIRRPFCPNK